MPSMMRLKLYDCKLFSGGTDPAGRRLGVHTPVGCNVAGLRSFHQEQAVRADGVQRIHERQVVRTQAH